MRSPDPVGLLRVSDRAAREERALHFRFRHLRGRDEWFRPGEDLLAIIAREATKEVLGMDDLYAPDAMSQKRFMRTWKMLGRTRSRFNEPGGTHQWVQ